MSGGVGALNALVDFGADGPGDFAVLQRYLRRQRQDQALTVGFSDSVTRLFGRGELDRRVDGVDGGAGR